MITSETFCDASAIQNADIAITALCETGYECLKEKSKIIKIRHSLCYEKSEYGRIRFLIVPCSDFVCA